MSAGKKEWLDSWHLVPSSNQDLSLIDGLRGIAILMVVVGHFIYINPATTNWLLISIGALAGTGYLGVSIFFTLSGFLISLPFWKCKVKKTGRAIPAGYGWRRFYKIYPPLALSIVCLAPFYVLTQHDPSIYWLVPQWLVGLPLIMPISSQINPVMWSLIVEVQFYLVLPLIFLCVKKVESSASLWIVFAALFLSGYASLLIYHHYDITFTIQPLINCPFPIFLSEFSLGVLLAGCVAFQGRLPLRFVKLGNIGFAILGVAIFSAASLSLHPTYNGFYSYWAIQLLVLCAAALMLCYIADTSHPVSRLLSASWLRWLGIISYEWYLLHQPIVLWTRKFLGPAGGSPFKYAEILVGSFLLSLALAALLYRYFSLPILRYGRSRHTTSPALKPNAPS